MRCSFCHVGEGDFLNWDFASDAMPNKEIARGMMRMTREINREGLADIEELFGSRFSAQEREQLGELLGRLPLAHTAEACST